VYAYTTSRKNAKIKEAEEFGHAPDKNSSDPEASLRLRRITSGLHHKTIRRETFQRDSVTREVPRKRLEGGRGGIEA
jgi:hypothetical protein